MGTKLTDHLKQLNRWVELKGTVFSGDIDVGIGVELLYNPDKTVITLPNDFRPYLPNTLIFNLNDCIPMEISGKVSNEGKEIGAQIFCLFDPRFYGYVTEQSEHGLYVDEYLNMEKSWQVLGKFKCSDVIERLSLQEYQKEWLLRMMGADECEDSFRQVIFRFNEKNILKEMEQPDLAPFEGTRLKVKFQP